MDKAKSNSTHVCCLCNHLTSFTASAKKAACKFCKVNVAHMATPSDRHKFRWHEPGVWVLMCLLMVLYAPCLPFVRMDRRDWKPIKTNKGAYFKDAVNGSASFRVCFGFIACAPTIVSCPPRCCVRRMGQQTSTKKALSVIHREEDSQRL